MLRLSGAIDPVAQVVVAQPLAKQLRRRGPGSSSRSGRRCSYEPNPSGEQFLHHALLEGGFVTAGFQGCDLSVHVGENSAMAVCSGFGGRAIETAARYLPFVSGTPWFLCFAR